MRKRTAVLALAILASTAGASAGRPLLSLSCGPSNLDIACRLSANLKVRARIVTSNAPLAVRAQSAVVTSGAGTAELYFTRYASCQLQSPTPSGTRLVTRQPRSFLFTQNYGATLCTFFNGAQALVADRNKLRSAATRNTQAFFIGVEATTPLAHVRIDFIPHAGLSIAVTGGSALLHLPTDAAQTLDSGSETTFNLDSQEQIVSTDTHAATFSGDESKIFDTQLEKLRKGRR